MEGLKSSGFNVIECHRPLWRGFDDRVKIASGDWKKISFLFRIISVYAKLIVDVLKFNEYDILYVAYPGYLDIFIAKIIATISRKPLVWDVLNSLYLMMTERGISTKSPFLVNVIKKVEPWSIKLPDMLFLDNLLFVNWFKSTYNLDTSRFRTVAIGGDNSNFKPFEGDHQNTCKFRVVYYGTYIPNHGVEYILKAAELLASVSDIYFEMIGNGPEYQKSVEYVKKARLMNVQFTDWVPWEELPKYLSNASVILGAFGTSLQLQLTNNNKVYEAMAMGKPVITGQSAALPEILIDGEHLLLARCGDPIDLANQILKLYQSPNLRESLRKKGYQVYIAEFTIESIGKIAGNYIQELL